MMRPEGHLTGFCIFRATNFELRMDYRVVSMALDGIKCPFCGGIIKVTRASDKDISMYHVNSIPACEDFLRELAIAYKAAINNDLTLRQLMPVAVGKN